MVVQREDQYDTTILVLEKEFVIANGLAQFIMPDYQVRTLCATDKPAG